MIFKDRKEAGLLLAKKLADLDFVSPNNNEILILAIPRGGVIVAKEIANYFKLPLGILIVRKIPAPNEEELAIGAVGPEGRVVLDNSLINQMGVSKEYISKKIRETKKEVKDRYKKFQNSKIPKLQGNTVILVDDGIATGATVEAAIGYLKSKKIGKLILAVPVAPRDCLQIFQKLVDELIVLEIPSDFRSVGQWYQNFPQIEDEEVIKYLK